MDFLCRVVADNLISEECADEFIKKVIDSGIRLPVKRWKESSQVSKSNSKKISDLSFARGSTYF